MVIDILYNKNCIRIAHTQTHLTSALKDFIGIVAIENPMLNEQFGRTCALNVLEHIQYIIIIVKLVQRPVNLHAKRLKRI